MLGDCKVFSGFSVKDLAATEKFYRDTLGFKTELRPMGLTLHFKTMDVFVYEKPNHQPASFTILNIEVDDIDAAVDELVKAGVQFEMYEDLPAKQDDKGILRNEPYNPEYGPRGIAWFKDPSDNILSLIQN